MVNYVSNGKKPYFVAEMNSSHMGNFDNAKQMIYEAKRVGCDAVKFQSWSAESLYSDDYYKSNPMAKRFVDKFSLSDEQMVELSKVSREVGIGFSSTPYSNHEVDILVEQCDVDFIKIASMEINNHPFLDYIARKNKPIILSTGMSDIEEIRRAVEVIKNAGNNRICILHCVSLYPVNMKDVNLNNILLFEDTFSDCEIGYSDHTLGSIAAVGAVAMGATVIEKHFTLDNSKIGWDNQMATEPDSMKEMIDFCMDIYSALGKRERVVSENEIEQRTKMRRSIVSKRKLEAGEIITAESIEFKRPGNGLAPEMVSKVVNKQLKKNLEKGEMILMEDVE